MLAFQAIFAGIQAMKQLQRKRGGVRRYVQKRALAPFIPIITLTFLPQIRVPLCAT
jgi:hypothetical protein